MVPAMVWKDCKCFREYIERVTSLNNSRTSDRETTAFLLSSMPTLYIIEPMRETEGATHVVYPTDWSALIPMWKIAIRRISPN